LFEQLADGEGVDVRVLAQVQSREMKPEHVDSPAQHA
jgi:hypothetical protein